jgi:hypothetical protein
VEKSVPLRQKEQLTTDFGFARPLVEREYRYTVVVNGLSREVPWTFRFTGYARPNSKSECSVDRMRSEPGDDQDWFDTNQTDAGPFRTADQRLDQLL